MNNKITTFLLTLILIILILGGAFLGITIYKDLTGEETKSQTYKLGNISTEEPEQRSSTNTKVSDANEKIQGISENIQSSNQISSDNENSINKYFYGQLSGNQKIIYNQLLKNKANLKQGNYKINFENSFSDTLSEENGGEKLGEDYQTAIEAFMHDNPEMFYIDVNKMYLSIETTTRLLKTTYNVYISPANDNTYLSNYFTNTKQVEEAIAKIEQIKNEVISNLKGSDYDKIMQIHDYLVDNIEYDSTYKEIGTYSVYGALIGKKCVCEGYAKSLKYLANQAGIQCEIMQGTATNGEGQTESHAWNCVKLGDSWYEIDATWDDPIIVGNGYKFNSYKYRYFLKGTNTFEKDHTLSYQFSQNGKTFEYPEISKRDY